MAPSCPSPRLTTLAVPTHAEVRLANASKKSPSHLFTVDDAPLQRKIRLYQVFE
jgi:gentisate 1,2-dioxygenase